MSPRCRVSLLVAALAVVAISVGFAGAAEARSTGAFSARGTVSDVVDGDTLQVVLAAGRTERVRLIGIDTPERGACYAPQATAAARRLALGKTVVVRGDATQDTRDRYGRLLAYVWISGKTDLGFQLISGGFGKPYVFRTPFERLGAYRRAEQGARANRRGLWSACGTARGGGAPAPARGSCHPNYSPCLPIVRDLDCADVRRMGKAPVRVVGADPYRLDGDGDGWGCE